MIALLGLVDMLTGSEISFSIFYLLPVALATWKLDRRWGITFSLVSGAVWLAADLAGREAMLTSAIPLWNALVRIGFFLLFVAVLQDLWETRERESRILADVQRRLIPDRLPRFEGVEIATTWQPTEAVGGDYFDVFRLSEHRLGLCIGDVAGKGMEAALVMSNLQAAVRALAPGGLSPNKLCQRLNELLASNVKPGRFVSFFYGILNTLDGTLVFCNAGHNPPIVICGGAPPQRLQAGGPVLGVFPQVRYQRQQIALSPTTGQSRLTLFTDGLTEATNRDGEEFGEERLLDLLLAHQELPVRELRQRILETVIAFHGRSFADDVTLLTISMTTAQIRHRLAR